MKIKSFTITKLKKKMKEIPKVHAKFLQQGRELGNRDDFMKYIWDELFAVQLGYALNEGAA